MVALWAFENGVALGRNFSQLVVDRHDRRFLLLLQKYRFWDYVLIFLLLLENKTLNLYFLRNFI